jgi:hypothetical protein
MQRDMLAVGDATDPWAGVSTVPLRLSFDLISFWKWQLFTQMEMSVPFLMRVTCTALGPSE